MENKLIKYFLRFTTLTTDETKTLNDSMVTKEFKKGDFIVKAGRRNIHTFFVLKGLVRQYKLIDGQEFTTNFFTQEQWILSLTSFTEDTISSDYLECIEDTVVVIGNEQKAQILFKKYPRFETISRAVMETVFSEQQKMMAFYLTDTPEQRYLRLLETKPNLLQRVPQYHIATYIGVKPESLSRIRKRIVNKSKSST